MPREVLASLVMTSSYRRGSPGAGGGAMPAARAATMAVAASATAVGVAPAAAVARAVACAAVGVPTFGVVHDVSTTVNAKMHIDEEIGETCLNT